MSAPAGIGRIAVFDPATLVAPAPRPSLFTRVVHWTFSLFSSLRAISYVPTLWAIYDSANSSQYSLLTWFTFVGANASMAAWLFEKNGRKVDRAVVVSACNAFLCLVTCLMIAWYR
jgi:hypothetical protein